VAAGRQRAHERRQRQGPSRWLARRRRGSELSSGLQWRFTLRPLPLHACGIKPESRLYFPSLKHESASLTRFSSSSLRHVAQKSSGRTIGPSNGHGNKQRSLSTRAQPPHRSAQKSSGRTIGPSNGYGNRQRSLSSRAQPPHRSTSHRATAPPSRRVSASPSLGRGLAPAAAAVPSPRPALHLAAALPHRAQPPALLHPS
jgi:hypothetical protein